MQGRSKYRGNDVCSKINLSRIAYQPLREHADLVLAVDFVIQSLVLVSTILGTVHANDSKLQGNPLQCLWS